MLYLEDAAFLHSVRLSEQVKVRSSDFYILHTADERASHDLPPANVHKIFTRNTNNDPNNVTAARLQRACSHLIGREAGNPPM